MTYNIDEARMIAQWLERVGGIKVDFEKHRVYHNRHAIYCGSEANLARALFMIADLFERVSGKSFASIVEYTAKLTPVKV